MTDEQKQAVETLDRAIRNAVGGPIVRSREIFIDEETAKTLRSLLDDTETQWISLELAESAYQQCDAKLKDALVQLSKHPKEYEVSFDRVLLVLWKHDLEFVISGNHLPTDSRNKLNRMLAEIARRL